MGSLRPAPLAGQLHRDIATCGYFPDLVADAIALAVGPEPVLHHLVHHEATFDNDEIHRHLSVLVITPSRLIVGHTDDASDVTSPSTGAATTTESIALRTITSVALTRVVAKAESFGSGRAPVHETWLSVAWGTMRRLEVEPAHCDDPHCDADHGYSGTLAGDDLTIRMSAAADGVEQVDRLVAFATALQLASAGGGAA